jgi:RNA polymerase sigma-70 factor, ECF subfamily
LNEDLMTRFQAGDESAFDAIVVEYKTRLFRFIRRFLGDPDEAEDVLQDLFVRLYRARETYRPEQKLEPYLYRIASNLCKDRIRRSRTTAGLDGGLLASGGPSPADSMEQKELAARLESAVQALPDNQRLVFGLVVFEDKSYEDTARITGFSLSAVKSLVFRARLGLKKRLGPQLS